MYRVLPTGWVEISERYPRPFFRPVPLFPSGRVPPRSLSLGPALLLSHYFLWPTAGLGLAEAPFLSPRLYYTSAPVALSIRPIKFFIGGTGGGGRMDG